jgi:lipopolysaccharide/colanic/teichoic acid biosynthesis glycosyltransferase
LASIPVARQASPVSGFTWQAVGICERLASAALLAALSPMIAASAAAVSLLSGQTPLIAHRRVGWRGATLWMLKLRTMWGASADASRRRTRWVEYIDDEAGPRRKHPEDPRVSNRFARFCRRHSIDELPQFWSVLRGDMSLVGPRPERPHFVEEFSKHIPQYLDRHRVKSGLTGWAQVCGFRGSDSTIEDRTEYDLFYVENWSLWFDLRILLRTVVEVFRGRGAM